MNALYSYLRHLFVTGILLAVEKLKLPVEGAEDAANVIALALLGTLSWLFAKYAPSFIKANKGTGLPLIILALIACFSLSSCTVSLDPTTNKPILSIDPEAVQSLANRAADNFNSRVSATK